MTDSQNQIISAALRYESLGFSVIPVGIDKKSVISWKEFQEKRATVDQIKEWWKKYPKANIGVITGEISGIAVIDIEKGGETKDIPQTVCSKTGGGGFHFFYKYPDNEKVKSMNRIRELTDIRGEGGYVIMPPSLHKSGNRYEMIANFGERELEEFPVELIKKWESERKQESSKNINAPVLSGKRNDTATKYIGGLLDKSEEYTWETEIWEKFQEWNKKNCNPVLETKELREIFESICKKEREQRARKKTPSKPIPSHEICSEKFANGTVLETIFDPIKRKTNFLVLENGEISQKPFYIYEKEKYEPLPSNISFLQTKSLVLPSGASPYQSEEKLFEEIRRFIHTFVDVSEEFEIIMTTYALFTWIYDEFPELPYLRVIGDSGTGKSRFLKVLQSICCRSLNIGGGTTESALFRLIDIIKGTLVIDETDFGKSTHSHSITKILNLGFQRDNAIYRSEGGKKGDFFPTAYQLFCPKIFASRRMFDDNALESRCLSYSTKPTKRADIPHNLGEDFFTWAQEIQNKCITYRFRKTAQKIPLQKFPLENIEPRIVQILNPLYSAIQVSEAREVLVEHAKEKNDQIKEDRFYSDEGRILFAFLELRKRKRNGQKIFIKEITAEFNKNAIGDQRLSEKGVGSMLRNVFHLNTKRTNTGFIIDVSQYFEKELEELKMKYGFMEEVNE